MTDPFFQAPMSFEADLLHRYNKIAGLRELLNEKQPDPVVTDIIAQLEFDLQDKINSVYAELTPIQKVEIARHPQRPHTVDYIRHLFPDFFELCGDRCFAEDKAIIAGFGSFQGRNFMLIGHEKGHDTESRKLHNFGMPMPEGYRKATRAMRIAAELGIPIVCFVDTPGAYPGIASEERGQGCALAQCMQAAVEVSVPIVSYIIGEGGSGGAVALGVANQILMLEHSIYSVISPEGCASILWKSKDKRSEAAEAQKLTAQDLLRYKLIDRIIPEPFGGAHRNPGAIMDAVGAHLQGFLEEYSDPGTFSEALDHRIVKYLNLTE